MNNLSLELQTAIEAAKKGAKYAMQFFGKEIKTDKKKDNTVFSIVDKETEDIIKNVILDKFSDAKFVGEETGGVPTKGKFWTIDPIDGTRYFVRNTPLWSVLISLIVDEVPVIGVSNIPCLNELTYAEKGKGAYTNNKRISVSNISSMKESLLMIGSMRFFTNKELLLKMIDACASARSIVSPYEFHLLASGRCEIILDAYGKIWDIAPFKVIVEEAGGKVANLQGKAWTIEDEGCVATNNILHNKVMYLFSSRS